MAPSSPAGRLHFGPSAIVQNLPEGEAAGCAHSIPRSGSCCPRTHCRCAAAWNTPRPTAGQSSSADGTTPRAGRPSAPPARIAHTARANELASAQRRCRPVLPRGATPAGSAPDRSESGGRIPPAPGHWSGRPGSPPRNRPWRTRPENTRRFRIRAPSASTISATRPLAPDRAPPRSAKFRW